jgi:hypothetical protein
MANGAATPGWKAQGIAKCAAKTFLMKKFILCAQICLNVEKMTGNSTNNWDFF